MTKKKKGNLPIDPDENLLFNSQEEFEQWLKDNDITEEEFLNSGGTVKRVTFDEEIEEQQITSLSEEQLETLYQLPKEEQEEYLKSLISGMS